MGFNSGLKGLIMLKGAKRKIRGHCVTNLAEIS
jgi:hypothetical protein